MPCSALRLSPEKKKSQCVWNDGTSKDLSEMSAPQTRFTWRTNPVHWLTITNETLRARASLRVTRSNVMEIGCRKKTEGSNEKRCRVFTP